MPTIFQNTSYPSSGTIPAYNAAEGNIVLEIAGANGRKLQLVNMDIDTTYGSFDNMTVSQASSLGGSYSIDGYLNNGDTTSGTYTLGTDPAFIKIAGAPSSASGRFYAEVMVETGVGTDTYEDISTAVGVTVVEHPQGTAEYDYIAPDPSPAVSCFWTDRVYVYEDCAAAPPPGGDPFWFVYTPEGGAAFRLLKLGAAASFVSDDVEEVLVTAGVDVYTGYAEPPVSWTGDASTTPLPIDTTETITVEQTSPPGGPIEAVCKTAFHLYSEPDGLGGRTFYPYAYPDWFSEQNFTLETIDGTFTATYNGLGAWDSDYPGGATKDVGMVIVVGQDPTGAYLENSSGG